MCPNKENMRFFVHPARVNGPPYLFCRDLDFARCYARRLSRIFNYPFEVYLTSVYYG